MDPLNSLVKLVPAGAIAAVTFWLCRFYYRQLVDIELHVSSNDTYCFVLDSERNSVSNKFSYFAQVKATFSVSSGSTLEVKDVHLLVENYNSHAEVDFSEPRASDNVRKFFNPYGKIWETSISPSSSFIKGSSSGVCILTAKGTAMWHEPFPNLPDGGYEVTIAIEFQRFLFLVPCRFASMNGMKRSVICGDAKVILSLIHI